MGSIIKYCDKVVLLHKGEFIAEGPAGKVVDMYKDTGWKAGGSAGRAGSGKASENGDAVELLKEKAAHKRIPKRMKAQKCLIFPAE